MSRGDRATSSGNLSTSMRDNYNEYGVSEYYKKVGSTYRNPHFPGIRLCLFVWLNKWRQMECNDAKEFDKFSIFDLACGSGEVTLACLEWWKTGKKINRSLNEQHGETQGQPSTPHQCKSQIMPTALGPEFPRPHIIAADPFTSAAYHDRTSLPCSPLSFKDITEGALPSLASAEASAVGGEGDDEMKTLPPIEMVICSFALHLIESSSELFSLLWELSLKSRWLVVLAPHKRPEVKAGWGWIKWDIGAWEASGTQNSGGELLHDRPVSLNDWSVLY